MDSNSNDLSLSQYDLTELMSILGSSSDEDDSCLPPDHSIQGKRRRKRVRKPYVRPAGLHVVKDDIRRAYPVMMTNVLNSGDFPLSFGYIHTFYTHDVRSTIRIKSGTLEDDSGHSYFGLNRVAQFICNTICLTPDSTFELLNAAVNYRNGTITCQMVATATQLYEYYSVDAVSQTQDWVVKPEEMELNKCNDSSIMKKIMYNVEKSMGNLVPLKHPQRLVIPCTIVISTDELKRVTAVEMVIDAQYSDSCVKSFLVKDETNV